MISYKITDDEINWKKEIDTDTAGTNATASVTEEDKLWNQFDCVCVWPPVKDELLLSMRFQSLVLTYDVPSIP